MSLHFNVIYIASEVPEIQCAAMAGNPREHIKNKGFWDGGASGHGTNKESSGRASGLPGVRKPQRVGINTDLEFPSDDSVKTNEPNKK